MVSVSLYKHTVQHTRTGTREYWVATVQKDTGSLHKARHLLTYTGRGDRKQSTSSALNVPRPEWNRMGQDNPGFQPRMFLCFGARLKLAAFTAVGIKKRPSRNLLSVGRGRQPSWGKANISRLGLHAAVR